MRPPAAQLLYDLGLQEDAVESKAPLNAPVAVASYPPCARGRTPTSKGKLDAAMNLPLPLRLTATPTTITARAARMQATRTKRDPFKGTAFAQGNRDAHEVVDEYAITGRDMAQVYFSDSAYNCSFEETLLLRNFDSFAKPTGGMKFKRVDDRLILAHMERSSPGTRIPR